MAPLANKVIGIEIVEEAVKMAKENASINNLSNVEFIAGDVLKEVDNLTEKPDLIILDPPREGINPKAIGKIIDFSPEVFVYVSCNPVTLVRDLKEFIKRGYNIEKVKCRDKKVYVFENPTVFSEVLYQTRKISPSTICTYGQLRLASLVLLDKIVQDDVKVYYSGDFDPEGIMIADKLKQRYGESLILWRYGIEEYNEIQSKVKLTEQRLKKLDNIKSPELQVIANEIKKRRYGAYQELLLEYYISDILEGI